MLELAAAFGADALLPGRQAHRRRLFRFDPGLKLMTTIAHAVPEVVPFLQASAGRLARSLAVARIVIGMAIPCRCQTCDCRRGPS